MKMRKFLIAVLACTMSLSLVSVANATDQTSSEVQPNKEEMLLEQQLLLQELELALPELIEEGKEFIQNNPELEPIRTRSSAVGLTGQVLVVPSGTLSFEGILGHAAIVSIAPSITIESYGEGFAPQNNASGVRYYNNDWNQKNSVYVLQPINSSKNRVAAENARSHVGKNYSMDFFNKERTDKFYCSQLVWRAWKDAGVDIDDARNGSSVVYPNELISSSNTRIVQSW